VRVADRLPHSKSRIQRLKQGRVTEWLEQELNGSLLERSPADNFVLVSTDKNDRNAVSAELQLSLEIKSSHARHGDVEDETSGLNQAIRSKELFRR
jgi:hypothetical protein